MIWLADSHTWLANSILSCVESVREVHTVNCPVFFPVKSGSWIYFITVGIHLLMSSEKLYCGPDFGGFCFWKSNCWVGTYVFGLVSVYVLTRPSVTVYCDVTQVAARTLGDLVRKLGERVLPEIIPILEKGLDSDEPDQRQGVCIGLSEIMGSTSREHVWGFLFAWSLLCAFWEQCFPRIMITS